MKDLAALVLSPSPPRITAPRRIVLSAKDQLSLRNLDRFSHCVRLGAFRENHFNAADYDLGKSVLGIRPRQQDLLL